MVHTMTSRFTAAGVAALAVAAMVLPSGAPARASVTGTTDEACLMHATSRGVQCYPSADALLEAVTGEAADGYTTADLADADTVARLETGLAQQGDGSQGSRAPGVPLAPVIAAIFYDGTFGNGAALVMEAPSGCDDDPGVEWAWPTLTADWRNRIRSGVGYARCDFKVWNHAWYAGAAYGFVASSGYLGVLDGAANSVRMR